MEKYRPMDKFNNCKYLTTRGDLMALLTMAFLGGLGLLGGKAVIKQSKFDYLIKNNIKDPESYVRNLIGEQYMKTNADNIKIGYMKWLDKEFVLSKNEMNQLSKEFDIYKEKCINKEKDKYVQKFEEMEEKYYNRIKTSKIIPHRAKIYIHKHYFGSDLENKMNKVLNNTFIGAEINKAFVENGEEEFLCLNTRLANHEIEKYYKACWNYIHNNDKDRY